MGAIFRVRGLAHSYGFLMLEYLAIHCSAMFDSPQITLTVYTFTFGKGAPCTLCVIEHHLHPKVVTRMKKS